MFSYILKEFVKEIGHPFRSEEDRASAIDKINKAAKELYETTDLVGSLREQVFSFDESKFQIVLPYYVDQIRGIRHYNTRCRVKLEDMRPRYFIGNWPNLRYLEFRLKNKQPLMIDLSNETRLKFVIPSAEDEQFKIYVEGSTDDADKLVEEIIFEAGDVEKETNNIWTQFPGIISLSKDSIIKNNINIYDGNGDQISYIANNELKALFTIIHVTDYQSSSSCDCYELLYKTKLSPFKFDYDSFPCGDIYDDAIVWKACAQYGMRKEGLENRVLMYEAKVQQILAQIFNHYDNSTEKELQFGRNRFLDVQSGSYPTGYFNKR